MLQCFFDQENIGQMLATACLDMVVRTDPLGQGLMLGCRALLHTSVAVRQWGCDVVLEVLQVSIAPDVLRIDPQRAAAQQRAAGMGWHDHSAEDALKLLGVLRDTGLGMSLRAAAAEQLSFMLTSRPLARILVKEQLHQHAMEFLSLLVTTQGHQAGADTETVALATGLARSCLRILRCVFTKAPHLKFSEVIPSLLRFSYFSGPVKFDASLFLRACPFRSPAARTCGRVPCMG